MTQKPTSPGYEGISATQTLASLDLAPTRRSPSSHTTSISAQNCGIDLPSRLHLRPFGELFYVPDIQGESVEVDAVDWSFLEPG